MQLPLRSLIWAIICPGTVAVVLPLLILNTWPHPVAGEWAFNQYTGLGLVIAGAAGLSWCIFFFSTKGSGTLSPLDPATKLVTGGLYGYIRNPMYLCVLSVILGEILFFNSTFLVVYGGVVFLAFHLFITYYEEPYLRKTFGKEYEDYCAKVRRWLPG